MCEELPVCDARLACKGLSAPTGITPPFTGCSPRPPGASTRVGLRLFDFLAAEESELFLADDDTLLSRRGLRVFGAGMRRDPLLSTRHHPVTRHPVTRHPVTRHPVTRHPVTRHPVTRHPVTRHPVTRHPVTRWRHCWVVLCVVIESRRSPAGGLRCRCRADCL